MDKETAKTYKDRTFTCACGKDFNGFAYVGHRRWCSAAKKGKRKAKRGARRRGAARRGTARRHTPKFRWNGFGRVLKAVKARIGLYEVRIRRHQRAIGKIQSEMAKYIAGVV